MLWCDGQVAVLERCHLSARETCQVEVPEECMAAWGEVRQHRESLRRHCFASVAFDIARLQIRLATFGYPLPKLCLQL